MGRWGKVVVNICETFTVSVSPELMAGRGAYSVVKDTSPCCGGMVLMCGVAAVSSLVTLVFQDITPSPGCCAKQEMLACKSHDRRLKAYIEASEHEHARMMEPL